MFIFCAISKCTLFLTLYASILFICRLNEALVSGTTFLAAKTEKHLMELYYVDTSIPTAENDSLDINETSKHILRSFDPVVLENFNPW